MIDPFTVAAIGAGVHGVGRLANARAEVTVLRAQAELARAVAVLPPGTEISGTGRNGSRWVVRVPAASPRPEATMSVRVPAASPRPRPTMSTESTAMSGQPVHTDRPAVPTGRTPVDLDMFWASYESTLRRYAWCQLDLWRIPRARADVDDVISEAYLDLRETWPTVRSPIAYARFRVEVAVLRALRDECRRGPALDADRDDAGDDDGGLDSAQPGLAIEDDLVERETETRLAEALPLAMGQLTDKQRQAVELCDVEDLSRDDAAASMGVATGTVGSHRARAVDKLRDALRPIMFTIRAVISVITVGLAGLARLAGYEITLAGTVLAVVILVLLIYGGGPRQRGGPPRAGK
jgi:RNA polymerase sigma factor (sigma-70 family)